VSILWGLLIFWAGSVFGFFFNEFLRRRITDYSGTIYVNRDRVNEKIVYSLVLDEYPEKLEFKKVVVFKVDKAEEEVDRD
jgi:hypothetical protein